ncbi:LytR C-terminal domain-containing protein [Calditrichota bacterium]
MSPNPRGRNRYSEDDPDRKLRTRLDLLIALMVVQLVISFGLWVDKSNGGGGKESAQQPLDTPAQKMIEQQAKPFDKAPALTQEPKAAEKGMAAETKSAPVPDGPVRVQILNGCGTSGIANKAGTWLTRNGYDVRDVGNADRHDYNSTIILDRTAMPGAATLLASDLKLDASRIQKRSSGQAPLYDVTLILGKDYKSLPFAR